MDLYEYLKEDENTLKVIDRSYDSTGQLIIMVDNKSYIFDNVSPVVHNKFKSLLKGEGFKALQYLQGEVGKGELIEAASEGKERYRTDIYVDVWATSVEDARHQLKSILSKIPNSYLGDIDKL